MRICKIDGCERPVYGKKDYCHKHWVHIRKYGKIQRTRRDPNEFIIKNEICKIKLYDTFGNDKAETIIDTEDYDKCKQYKWCYHKNHHVCSIIDGKMIPLHAFVLGTAGTINKEIIHKNENNYDNRKTNLELSLRHNNPLRKRSKETREKMSKARIGVSCPWVTKALKGRLRPDLKGKKFTDERKAKLKGRIPWNKGKKMNTEWCQRCSLANKGQNSHFWKGGVWANNIKSAKVRTEKKRREKLKKNGGWHSKEEWTKLKEKYNFICLSCGKKEPIIKLTEDHIIPISKNGNNTIENIQPLCKKCNSTKGTKVINYKKKEAFL